MNAIDKAREKARQIGKEVKAEKEKQEAEVKKELAVYHGAEVLPEVIDFFKVHANAGSANLAGSLPQLKVTEALSKNKLTDGKLAEAGSFYYAPSQESFKELEVCVMTISRGFYAMSNDQVPVPKFIQLMGGMIVDSMQPFIMFFSSTRLENLWNFGKEIRPMTKNKKAPIPMFSLLVKLTTEKRVNDKKQESHVVKFELLKDKEGNVKFIDDLEFLSAIRAGVDSAEEMIDNFIDKKEVDRATGEVISESLDREEARVETVVPGEAEPETPKDKIPF